ncbi:helix-turn-helix domain-containing protein [Sporichthya sp.]|uniref:helix-turn-helix domain-containing protein n=1 Tax=Sporichthya sp. TaxID=65475 RepID=UPI0017F6F9AD|nr:helix-turn-helix transcriptional regulator [Sporichthya sp.]
MCVPEDESLLRDRAGIARSRATDESLDSVALEVAIARNVRDLRTHRGLSVADMAVEVGISKAMLSKIENAQTACSLSTLAALARGLDVPVTSLFRGADTERQVSYVKAGRGTRIVRNGSQAGHDYELLGTLRGEHKRLECLMVTLTAKSDTYPLFQHPGTEFIYMLEGKMDYEHGRSTYRLGPGDSLQFDGEGTHGPAILVQVPIRFLSVIAFPDISV